jgi:hypothetical protein
MNSQELFDIVAKHLLTQDRQSLDSDGSCMYRGCGGRMCAIGVLIPDELYEPWMDANGALTRVIVAIDLGEHYELCRRLQRVHDVHLPAGWRHQLKLAAYDFGLEFNL